MHLLSKKYGANNMRIKCAFNVHLMRIKCAFSALFREGSVQKANVDDARLTMHDGQKAITKGKIFRQY